MSLKMRAHLNKYVKMKIKRPQCSCIISKTPEMDVGGIWWKSLISVSVIGSHWSWLDYKQYV